MTAVVLYATRAGTTYRVVITRPNTEVVARLEISHKDALQQPNWMHASSPAWVLPAMLGEMVARAMLPSDDERPLVRIGKIERISGIVCAVVDLGELPHDP